MRVETVSVASVIDIRTRETIQNDIQKVLEPIASFHSKKMIVNDTLWFSENNKGKATPRVMNSAKYITKAVRANLNAVGWQAETNIGGQEIDGYHELGYCGGLRVNKQELLQALEARWEDADKRRAVSTVCEELYQKFYLRECFETDDQRLLGCCSRHESPGTLRVGFEFETGNIASSFRALSKLDNLFRKGSLDIGVFVTSIDKQTAATRIWPTSNRNGSFEELKNRGYKDNVLVPLVEFGIAPDGFSKSAPYLGEDGAVYEVTWTAKEVVNHGTSYQIYQTPDGQEVLKPK